jgi:hypothetical protein
VGAAHVVAHVSAVPAAAGVPVGAGRLAGPVAAVASAVPGAVAGALALARAFPSVVPSAVCPCLADHGPAGVVEADAVLVVAAGVVAPAPAGILAVRGAVLGRATEGAPATSCFVPVIACLSCFVSGTDLVVVVGIVVVVGLCVVVACRAAIGGGIGLGRVVAGAVVRYMGLGYAAGS